jgi:hypothetical protein
MTASETIVVQLEEALQCFNVQLERYTPPIPASPFLGMSRPISEGRIVTPRGVPATHMFFGGLMSQTRADLDPKGVASNDEYWKVRRNNLCHMVNRGAAWFIEELIKAEGVKVQHGGAEIVRVGMCAGDYDVTEVLPMLAPEFTLSPRHEWVVVDLSDGQRYLIDLGAIQYDVSSYDRNEIPCYITRVEPGDTSPSKYPAAVAPDYFVMGGIAHLVLMSMRMGPDCRDAQRIGACIIESFETLLPPLAQAETDRICNLMLCAGEMDTLAEMKHKLIKTLKFPADACGWCRIPRARGRCQPCKQPYCTQACQRADWKKSHKRSCPGATK